MAPVPQNSRECLLFWQHIFTAGVWGHGTMVAAIALTFTLPLALKTTQFIGSGYLDMTFIDHSDNFQECHRPLSSDVRNIEGSFMASNQSLCEEKQFESQVVQPEWMWGHAKYIDLYMFNVTNPDQAAGGDGIAVQELAPIFLSSRNVGGSPAGVVTVDRDSLDNNGILTYKIDRTWGYRVERTQRTRFDQRITLPHYFFAAALHNGMQMTDMISVRTSHYPLFVTLQIGELLGLSPYSSKDPATWSASDAPFTLDMLDHEPTATSYFVSMRSGVQGFGFIRHAWNGQDIHCGYDQDCADMSSVGTRAKPFHQSKEKALETSRSCVASEVCQPTSLKRANNGIEFGVSAFKHFPSASFFEIPEVTGELWNYHDYTKPNTIWTGLNTAYFFLYDIKLDKEINYMRIQAHQWSLSKLHRRNENCGAATGDSEGLDCSGPQSALFVGAVRDALRPGPIYFSQAESNRPSDDNLEISTCEDLVHKELECARPLKNNFQMTTSTLMGSRICHRESSQISLKMQTSTTFGNKDPLVPLAWKKDHVCLQGPKLFELMRITITETKTTEFVAWMATCLVVTTILFFSFNVRAHVNWRKTDTTDHLSDKPCV